MTSLSLRNRIIRKATKSATHLSRSRRHPRLGVQRLEERAVPATFTVFNTMDGVVTQAGDLPGSLRQAIFDANDLAGADTIDFDPNVFAIAPLPTIFLGSELLINDPNALTITNKGNNIGGGTDVRVNINGGGANNRVFNIDAAGNAVHLLGLILDQGNVTGNGGAILIENSNVTMTNCEVRNSIAVGGSGGGVYLDGGSLTLSGGTIGGYDVLTQVPLGNSADGEGGGVFVAAGTLTLDKGTVSYNSAVDGGGIYVADGSVVMDGAEVSANIATGNGGGILMNAGSLTFLNSCQLDHNIASDNGGGIYSRIPLTLTNSTAIFFNTATGSGGGIYADEVPVTLTAGETGFCSIDNNEAKVDGGGIYINADLAPRSLIVHSASISDNTADGSGGGVYSEYGTVTVEKASKNDTSPIISSNEAIDGKGGGVYSKNGPSAKFTNAMVTGNTAKAAGGGICMDAGSLHLTDCSISLNQVTGGNGGGIAAGNVTVISSVIDSNTASANGGGLFTGGTVTITSSKVTTNSASNNGGGIWMSNGTLVISAMSTDTGNIATVNGGGFYLANTMLTMGDCTVTSDRAETGDGGGALFDGGEFTIENSLFGRSCYAGKSGGAIALRNGKLTLMYSDIGGQDCQARETGGGISATGGTLKAEFCTIGGTLLNDPFGQIVTKGGALYSTVETELNSCMIGAVGLANLGGGIYLSKNSPTLLPTLKACTVNGISIKTISDKEGDGGGIYVDSSTTVTITSTTVSGSADQKGGGIYTKGALTIDSSTITGSSAGAGGGGINMAGGSLSLKACTIDNNTAQDPIDPGVTAVNGGGLFLSAKADIENCTFSANTASYGGGIAFDKVTSPLLNCTITANVALGQPAVTPMPLVIGGGILVSDETDSVVLDLKSTLVAANTGTDGPDIGGNGTVKATYCLIGVGNKGFTKSTVPGQWANNLEGNDTIALAPQLTGLDYHGGPTFTHRLLPNSPAIDKGKNASGSSNDQRSTGFLRVYDIATVANAIDGDGSDIGAYELQAPKVKSVVTYAESAIDIPGLRFFRPSKSRVTFIEVIFDQPVEFATNVKNAFSFSRISNPAPGPIGPVTFEANLSPAEDSVIIESFESAFVELSTTDQFRSLIDGRYDLKVLANQVSVSGLNLAGGLSGASNTDYWSEEDTNLTERRIWRLFGDEYGPNFPADASVAINDFNLFRNAMGSNSSNSLGIALNFISGFDFNGDGSISIIDFNRFREAMGNSI